MATQQSASDMSELYSKDHARRTDTRAGEGAFISDAAATTDKQSKNCNICYGKYPE